MGTQQAKSEDELLMVHDEQQQSSLQEQEKYVVTHVAEEEIINEIHPQPVMTELNLILAPQTKCIKVANFAKIKTKPRTLDEYPDNELFERGRREYVLDAINFAERQNNIQQDIEIDSEKVVSLENYTICSSVTTNDISSAAEVEINRNLILKNPYSSAKKTQNLSYLKVKKELLEYQQVEINSTEGKPSNITLQNNTISAPEEELTENNIDDIVKIKTESIEFSNINDKVAEKENIVWPPAENYKLKEKIIEVEDYINTQELQNHDLKKEIIEIDSSIDEEEMFTREQDSQNYHLVKNPFAFLKNRSNKKKSRKQHESIEKNNKDDFLNNTFKSEIINLNDELNKEGRHKSPLPTKNTADAETVQPSINLKELIIKSEALSSTDANQEVNVNNIFYNNCLSNNLYSSLDVNLSNVETDFDEALSKQSIEEVISNISINTSTESLKYSIIELSSVENDHAPVKNTTIVTNSKTQENLKQQKSKIRRPYKARQKRNLLNINQGMINKQINKRGRKPKSKNTKKTKKYTEKDFSLVSKFSKKNILKNLPKSCVKTRKILKANAQKETKKPTVTKEDFPKPIKSESPTILQKEHNIATELPKPMIFKMESDINVKNEKQYLKAEFQPYVRLKRLKREELLVPLKTKHVRKTRQSKSSSNIAKRLNYHQILNDNRRDFLIHHAFSLNERMKQNRLSIDHDHSYYRNNQNNDQPSMYNHLTTPYSIPTDTPNYSLAETDSKYFSPQEMYSLFHHFSTPESSSIFSGHIDSGVSTSTHDYNRILLLEIAAERAFINNHLLHFGHSPIQFNLYNNLNDLNIFLKYLLGSVNMN